MDRLYFDIETTNADVATAKIVQLAIKIVSNNGTVLINKSKMYNPGTPISKEATAVHGITNVMVKNCPPFKEDAKKLKKLFEDKIIVTYNGMVFDLPILMNEFDTAGVDVDFSGKFIDVFKIEQKINQRNLASVYRSYTGQTLDNAHDAHADINATEIVLDHQMDRIIESNCDKTDFDLTDNLYELSGTKNIVDFYGKFNRDEEGFLTYNFGKHKGKRILDEADYADWMLKESFPSQVKKLIVEERKKAVRKTFSRGDRKSKAPSSTSFMNQSPDKLSDNWLPISQDALDAADDLPF